MQRMVGMSVWVVLTCLMPVVGRGADWPCWRGPNHDGISGETDFRTTWEGAPKRLWSAPVGSAFSSFACVGSKVYTCGTRNKQQVLFCFDAVTGRVIWETPFEPERRDPEGGDGTRATPTWHDGRVYILGGHGRLLCVDDAKGAEIWSRKLTHEPQWGYASSVLIEGDMAVVCAGGSDGGLLALDRKTGREIWKCGTDPGGYSSPYPFTFNGKRYIVGFLAKVAIIAEARTGREVWRMPWKTDWDVNAPQPIFHDGCLFLSSGYRTGCAVFRLSEDGEKLSGLEVWRRKDFLSKIHSCVLWDGVLYGSDQNRSLWCLDFKTGRELWTEPGMANASVLLAGDHLLVLTQNGRLIVAKASKNGFKPSAEAQILDKSRSWTIPTLANGRLYARNLKEAICLDLSAGERLGSWR